MSATERDGLVVGDQVGGPEIEDAREELDPTPPTETYLPATFHHCVNLYALMSKDAEATGDGLIWTGSLLRTIMEGLGLGNAHYTAITRALKRMKCIQQLRRGGGPQPSIWRLLKAPTPAMWRLNFDSAADASQQNKPSSTKEQTAQRLRDLQLRLDRIERIAIANGWPL